MISFLKRLFSKKKEIPPVEYVTYEVGKVDLIFMFKDGAFDRHSFTGSVSLEEDYSHPHYIHYDLQKYVVTTALIKAIDFIEARQQFGWYMKTENLLVPMSTIEEIIVAKHPHSVTVEKV